MISRMARRVSEQMEQDFGPAPVPNCKDTAARLAVEGAPTIRERWALEAVKRCQTVETADLSWVPGISNDKGGVSTFPSLVVTRPPAPASMYANDNVPAVARRGDYMQTYTGRKFWPLDARPDDVDIRDIAHALSMLCRYGGHSLRFYSVAEHSVHIARWLDARNYKPDVVFAGLLHDATEAYLTDVPRPLKRSLPDYREAESALWTVIAEAFGLTGYEDDLPTAVHEADDRILADEIRQNMKPMGWHARHDKPLGVSLQFWSPERAEREFLSLFADLVERIDNPPLEYPEADREASRADWLIRVRKEGVA